MSNNSLEAINIAKTFTCVLNNCSSKYGLDHFDSALLVATFFRNFYTHKAINDLLDKSYAIAKSSTLKSFFHDFNRTLKEKCEINLSHATILNLASDFIDIKSKTSSIKMQFVSINMFTINEDEFNIYMQNKLWFVDRKILSWSYKIIKKFCTKALYTIPFEIVMILICDVYFTYQENKKKLEENTSYEYGLVFDSIIEKFYGFGRIIINELEVRNEPPKKDDMPFAFKQNFYDPGYSLPLLCEWFGHETWYKMFNHYNPDRKDYFNFYDELVVKIIDNKREYEEHIFKCSKEELFSKNIENVFEVWSKRVDKYEFDILEKYIKPVYLKKFDSIRFEFKNFSNIENLYEVLRGLQETSKFENEYEGSWGIYSLIESLMSADEYVEVHFHYPLQHIKEVG